MVAWFRTDWGQLFIPQMSLPEILVRGTLVYLAIVLLLRVILKRQAGKVGLSDLLVITIVAGVCRNPLVRDASSITDGLLVVSTVLLWSFALDWLSYYSPFIHKLLHAKPVPLIRDGVVLSENLARELITDMQLQSKLRHEGLNDPSLVAEAWLEGDGHVSVVPRRPASAQGSLPKSGTVTDRNKGERRLGGGGGVLLNQVPSTHRTECSLLTTESSLGGVELLRMRAVLEERLAWHRGQMAEHERTVEELTKLLGGRSA